jgi:glucose-1-phosphate cytidylyltransferase
MKVVILCGGYGTRIRGVADNIPKPMIELGGRPILWHIMKYYSCWNYNEFVLCLGYKGQVIRDFFLNYDSYTRDCTINLGAKYPVIYHNIHSEAEWDVTLAETGIGAMTGARIRRVQKYLAGERDFMLTYGDGLSNIDLNKLLRFHQSHDRVMTVSGVRPPGRFGELVSDEDGTVLEFNEKPQASGGRISGGFFVCRRELFDYLPDREDLVLEVEPMRRLVEDRQLMVYEHDGFWQPMDTDRDYRYLSEVIAKDEAPWMLWEGKHAADVSR